MQTSSSVRRLGWGAAITAIGVLSACENVGSDLGAALQSNGTVAVLVYLDRDGSRTPTVLDTVFAKARVALLLRGGRDTVQTKITDANGVARFQDVALGQYRIVVDSVSVGDSIKVQQVDSASGFHVAIGDTVPLVARLGYPEVSIRQARTMQQGRRVFIRGVVLAGVQSFRDTTSHIVDSSGFLRLTRVSLRAGLTGNNPGDSVSVLGLTSVRLGLPTLDNAALARFGTRPPPIPIAIGTGTAATASNGTLDAALIQVTGATISDTATAAPDFRVQASDGSGTIEIILDGGINFIRSAFRPTRSMNVRGVLVPDGLGKWQLKPRDLGDVTFN